MNLGAGGQTGPGWTSLDRAGDVDVIHDLTELRLPFDDNSVDGAIAHHVLDLLNPLQIADLLRDVRRVLKPGAMLRVSSAHLEAGIEAALNRQPAWFPEPRGSLEETLGWFITQGGARRSHLNPERLYRAFVEAAFAWSAHQPAGRTLGPEWLIAFDSRPEESFYVEAAK